MNSISCCAIHTMTNKPWSLVECCAKYGAAGVGGISVWRDVVLKPNEVPPTQFRVGGTAGRGPGIEEAARIVKGSGLSVPAYVRGGFFPADDGAARAAAVDDNRRMLDEAAALGADQVVLVVGAVPGMAMDEARKQVAEGIAACLPHAESVGVKLSIEPLHPMYAADKSCVNRMAEARAICERLASPWLGIACDVYHVWWDPDLPREIALAGEQGTLFGFHVCDWRVDTRHLLTDRGLMGEGCVDIAGIRAMVEAAGFAGFCEVEVFSEHHWGRDQDDYLADIVDAFARFV